MAITKWVYISLAFLLLGCSPAQPGDIQTEVAKAAQTAAKEGGRVVQTNAAKLKDTAEPALETQAVRLKETAQAEIATQAARLVATQVPASTPPPTGDGVATYIVVEGDTLSKIASKFSIPVQTLVDLNRERYPSLVTNPDHVEVDWVLIASTPEDVPAPAPPAAPTPWSNTPGCDVSTVYWLVPPITCEESVVNVVTEIGHSVGCINLEDNPLGYYIRHTIYKGWILTDANNVVSYGWFVDKERNSVVVGPAIVLETTPLVECAIPGNP